MNVHDGGSAIVTSTHVLVLMVGKVSIGSGQSGEAGEDCDLLHIVDVEVRAELIWPLR